MLTKPVDQTAINTRVDANEQAIKGVEVHLGDVRGQLHDIKEMLSAVLCEVRQQQHQQ
jgi:hypothetical protein